MYERVLIVVADEPAIDRAVEEALCLAGADARFRLVHVLQPAAHITGFERPSVYIGQILPALREHGERLLRCAWKKLAREGRVADTRLIDDGPLTIDQAIVAEAARWGADLIVMSTHGRHGLDRLAMGSHAEAVLRHTPVPVLLVRDAGPHRHEKADNSTG
jgi:nucleotide-binding universal stress UspA family protein